MRFPIELRWALLYLVGVPIMVYDVLRHIFAPQLGLNEWFETSGGEFALEVSGAIGLIAFVIHRVRNGD